MNLRGGFPKNLQCESPPFTIRHKTVMFISLNVFWFFNVHKMPVGGPALESGGKVVKA